MKVILFLKVIDSETMLNAFGAIATALGVRMKAYIVQVRSILIIDKFNH